MSQRMTKLTINLCNQQRLISACTSIKHYENTSIQIHLEFYHQKNENFQIKNLIFFMFSLKT